MQDWQQEQISRWLASMGLQDYEAAFQGMTGEVLLGLQPVDLDRLTNGDAGDRDTFLKGLDTLRGREVRQNAPWSPDCCQHLLARWDTGVSITAPGPPMSSPMGGQRWVASTRPMPWTPTVFMNSYSSATTWLPPSRRLAAARASAASSTGRSAGLCSGCCDASWQAQVTLSVRGQA